MNRHARRMARSRGCLAPYTVDGGPGVHAPADCDGTCRAHAAEVPAALVAPLCAYLAEVVSGSESAADGAALRMLTLVVREDLARLRAVALAPFLPPRDVDGSAWARLRAVLEARGLIRPRGDRLARGAAGVAVMCCPHTGPPALAAAPGAPVILP